MSAKAEQINRALKKRGFGGLEDPNVVQHLAFCVRDHDHFRTVLMGVVPAERVNAYEAMRPHLRFQAKPLDVYVAEAADLAARKEYDSTAIDVLAEKAIAQSRHEKDGGLTVKCSKCTKVELFRAASVDQARKAAHTAGWRGDGKRDYCPGCVPTRGTIKLECAGCGKRAGLRCWDPQDGYRDARRLGWLIADAALCPDCAVKATTGVQ